MRKTYLVCTLLDILKNTSGKSVSEKSSTIKYNITFAYDNTRRSSLYPSSVNGMFVPDIFSTISPDSQQSLSI